MGAILWRGQLDFGDVPGDVPEGAERWLQLGVGEVQVGDVPEVLERDLQPDFPEVLERDLQQVPAEDCSNCIFAG